MPTGVVDRCAKTERFKRVFYTIPAVASTGPCPHGPVPGGTLNDERISGSALITEGTGWEEAKEYAVHGFLGRRSRVTRATAHAVESAGLVLHWCCSTTCPPPAIGDRLLIDGS
jgi:hypothetical protein